MVQKQQNTRILLLRAWSTDGSNTAARRAHATCSRTTIDHRSAASCRQVERSDRSWSRGDRARASAARAVARAVAWSGGVGTVPAGAVGFVFLLSDGPPCGPRCAPLQPGPA